MHGLVRLRGLCLNRANAIIALFKVLMYYYSGDSIAAGPIRMESDAPHPTSEDLESYSLGRLAVSPTAALEKHLLICLRCRASLNAIEPYNFVHYTNDGPFYSRITKLRTGMFLARHWGQNLEGGKEFRTYKSAKAYLARTFSQMFPKHICTAWCGFANCI